MKNKLLNKSKEYFIKARIEMLVIAVVIFLDLLSKFLVDRFAPYGKRVPIIPKFFNIFYTHNTAAAFSSDFGLSNIMNESQIRIFFIVFVSLAICAFATLLVRGIKQHLVYRLSLALIVSGGVGNLYDRIVHGAVRDFVQIEYFGKKIFGSSSFAIFNIADSALVIGVGLFVFYTIFLFSKDEKRLKEQREEAENKKKEDNSAADQAQPQT